MQQRSKQLPCRGESVAHGEVSDRVALKDNRAKGRRMERRDGGLEKEATWGMGRAQSKEGAVSRTIMAEVLANFCDVPIGQKRSQAWREAALVAHVCH